MEEYTPGSREKREETTERAPIDKVITGVAKTRKKSYAEKAWGSLKRDAGSILKDLILERGIPGAKDIAYDIIVGAARRKLYQDNPDDAPRYRERRSERYRGSNSYSRYYDDRDRDRRPRAEESESERRRYIRKDMESIILETRGEAEEVIDHMYDILENYGSVSIADLYELVGISPSFTDHGYGWRSLKGCGIEKIRSRHGETEYEIVLPRPISLK